MVFLADDFGAWLVAALADAGRKRLAAWVLGDEQERALRKAAGSAVGLTAQDLRPEDDQSAEYLARVIDQVFSEPAPALAPEDHPTVLQALQAGVLQQLAVLDDKSVTGTGQSASDELGVPGKVLVEVLAHHLVGEIIARGTHGGPLEPLANQLNHDATHLQNQRAESKIDRLDEKLIELLTRFGDLPAGVDQSGLISGFVPPALYQILCGSPRCLDTAESLFLRYCGLLDTSPGSQECQKFTLEWDHLLRVAMANVHADALTLMSSRDAVVLFALAGHLTYCTFLPIPVLADLIAFDKNIRATWVEYVDSVKKISLRGWRELAGDQGGFPPDTDALGGLSSNVMTGAERFAVELYKERQYRDLSASTIRTGRYSAISASSPEPFPRFWDICSAVLAVLDERAYILTEQLNGRLSGVRIIAGCHVLYLAMLIRTGISVRRLIEIDDDGVLAPVHSLPSRDHRLWTIQRQMTDIQPENEDDTEVLRIVSAPDSPYLLAGVREEVESVRHVIDHCTATLAQYYVSGAERALRLRYPRLRSSVDDPYRYVRERRLPFDPELARLTMDAANVLPLLVRPLYGDVPQVGIRELLQNALDAVSARDAIAKGIVRYLASDDQPKVRIVITISDGTDETQSVPLVPLPDDWKLWIEIRDTGVGMTSEVIRGHFMTVGGSFDPLTDSRSPVPDNLRPTPRSGRFGVGVLASFLLGSEIQVVTRHISAAEDEGLHFRLAEYAGEAELRYCRAPVGTTVRVKLDQATADKLVNNPDTWDWFHYTEPSVMRCHVNSGILSSFKSTLPLLDRNRQANPWRKLTVPAYGDVFWAPSTKPYESQIFVNGIRVVSLHRGRKNIMGPVEQLKQPVISIVDQNQLCEFKLTRDGFIEYPDAVFSAVRRDSIADHIAWLVWNAQRGLDQQLQWESEIWEEDKYSSGSGDGTTRAVPFIVAGEGIIPLHRTLLRQAGIAEFDFFLTRGGLTTSNETGGGLPARPGDTVRALNESSDKSGYPAGLLKVDMYGGFGYSTLAAGIQETFYFAGRVGPRTALQIVTVDRGNSYAKMYDDSVMHAWDDALALVDERSRSYIILTPDDRASMEKAESEIQRFRNERIQPYLTSFMNANDARHTGKRFGEILDAGYYGLMHVWLGEDEGHEKQGDEIVELWHAYGLPALLPFGLNIQTLESPLAGDLYKRTQRISSRHH